MILVEKESHHALVKTVEELPLVHRVAVFLFIVLFSHQGIVYHRNACHRLAFPVGDGEHHFLAVCLYQAAHSEVGNEAFHLADGTVAFPADAGLDILYIPRAVVDVLIGQQFVVVRHKAVLIIYAEDEVFLIHIYSRQVLQDDADMVGVLYQRHGVFVAAAVIVDRQRYIQRAVEETVQVFLTVCARFIVLTVQRTLQLFHTGLAHTGFGYGE